MVRLAVTIEILGFAGCPNFSLAAERARAALQETGLQAEIREVFIESEIEAHEAVFLGSPTIRVNDLDVEIAARSSSHSGLVCRTYVVDGRRHGLPPQTWIEACIREMSNESHASSSR